MRVIFLDIDGVLNTNQVHNPRGFPYVVEDRLVDRFNRLVERTSARVVLMSTWRLDPIGLLAAKHFRITFSDVTPDMPDGARSAEILAWLKAHPEVERFVVLDDTDDGFETLPFFQTSMDDGLTPDISDGIEAYLLGHRHTSMRQPTSTLLTDGLAAVTNSIAR